MTYNTDNEDIKWMKDISGIEIPKEAIKLKFYNNHEWGLIVKYKFNKSDVLEKFIENYGLTAVESSKTNEILLIENIERKLYEEDFSVKIEGDFFLLSDCKPGNIWHILANKKTNEIWFELLYPDSSGDISECVKAKKKEKVK